MKRHLGYAGVFLLGIIAGWGIQHLTYVPASSVAADRQALSEQLTMATLWFQQSSEARAMYYQTYNWARRLLDAYLEKDRSPKPPAIVVDIDETVLDNSPYEAWLIQTGNQYPRGWPEWVHLAQARALPGAVEFLQYAHQKGVTIFYVSNRQIQLLEPTIRNLKDQGFPQADTQHVLLRTNTSSKEPRRQQIARRYHILLFLGDNLNDFSRDFEKQSLEARHQRVDQMKRQFGQRYLILPNPMYGEWEGAIYEYNWNLPEAEKLKRRKAALLTAPLSDQQ
ncbi:MAG: 5'-nucleotidase, lipoprotein e(P4) family [Calditrichaeota bacterium]|nr:5'-nucleotidase, lipoprotein e(P4) family [Calditrichota bacterium]